MSASNIQTRAERFRPITRFRAKTVAVLGILTVFAAVFLAGCGSDGAQAVQPPTASVETPEPTPEPTEAPVEPEIIDPVPDPCIWDSALTEDDINCVDPAPAVTPDSDSDPRDPWAGVSPEHFSWYTFREDAYVDVWLWPGIADLDGESVPPFPSVVPQLPLGTEYVNLPRIDELGMGDNVLLIPYLIRIANNFGAERNPRFFGSSLADVGVPDPAWLYWHLGLLGYVSSQEHPVTVTEIEPSDDWLAIYTGYVAGFIAVSLADVHDGTNDQLTLGIMATAVPAGPHPSDLVVFILVRQEDRVFYQLSSRPSSLNIHHHN
jgi:hypothetical protein